MQVLSSLIFRWGAGGEGGGWRQRRSGRKGREKQVFWSIPCPVLYRVLLTESQSDAAVAVAPFIET